MDSHTQTTQSNQEFVSELINMLEPFSQSYTKDMGTIHLGKATAYQLAIAMTTDILLKLYDIKEKESRFSQIVVERLWSISSTSETDSDSVENVNIIEILYNFLTICGSYPDSEFKTNTYEACTIRAKKEKFNPDYDITFKQAEKQLEEAKFIEMFRAFRSIVGRIFRYATGSYGVPNIETVETWTYNIKVDGKFIQKTSHEFSRFMIELLDVFMSLEKLTPSLNEIYSVFNDAATMSKLAYENRVQTKDKVYSRPQFSKSHTKQVTQQQVQPKQEAVRSIPIPTITGSQWGKINPVTGKDVQKTLVLQQETTETIVVASAEPDDFIVVVRKKKSNNDKTQLRQMWN